MGRWNPTEFRSFFFPTANDCRAPFLSEITEPLHRRVKKAHVLRRVWDPRRPQAACDSATGNGPANFLCIGTLCCLWLGLVAFGWARWGSVTVDSGREIYVAAALAQGKMLYRDLWYPYGPGAPYLNAFLFLIFGTHINVAFLAGALAALAVALTLFRCALYLTSISVAFAVGYVVLVQSFGPGIFSYPLPYSYAAVYGSVAAGFFLLHVIRAAFDQAKANIFWASLWSAAALLMKIEYGFACFATLAALQVGLMARQRSWRAALGNLLVIIPALLICAAVTAWMVSIRGVDFITQENFTSWPTSYFMQKYGRFWLRGQGLELSREKILGGLLVTTAFVIFWTGFRFWLASVLRRPSFRNVALAIVIGIGAAAFWVISPERINETITMLIFPLPMVFMVGLAVPVMLFLFCRRWQKRDLAILLTLVLGFFVAVRILFGMMPYAYAIFYNGPALLAFCWLLLSIAIPGKDGTSDPRVRNAIFIVGAILCAWVTAQVYPDYREIRRQRVEVKSARGTIYLPEAMLPGWSEAANFMRQAKAKGQAVMSIPEDTALYFFSGMLCPIRVCIFHPGVVAPGQMMHQVIGEMREAQVPYIIWSNRKFYEYGVSDFGVDFDIPLGDYIRNHYRPVREFGSSTRSDAWHATLWKKNSESEID